MTTTTTEPTRPTIPKWLRLRWIVSRPAFCDLGAVAARLLVIFVRHADADGRAFPGLVRLSLLAAKGNRSRCLQGRQELLDAGVLAVENEGDSRNVTRYRLGPVGKSRKEIEAEVAEAELTVTRRIEVEAVKRQDERRRRETRGVPNPAPPKSKRKATPPGGRNRHSGGTESDPPGVPNPAPGEAKSRRPVEADQEKTDRGRRAPRACLSSEKEGEEQTSPSSRAEERDGSASRETEPIRGGAAAPPFRQSDSPALARLRRGFGEEPGVRLDDSDLVRLADVAEPVRARLVALTEEAVSTGRNQKPPLAYFRMLLRKWEQGRLDLKLDGAGPMPEGGDAAYRRMLAEAEATLGKKPTPAQVAAFKRKHFPGLLGADGAERAIRADRRARSDASDQQGEGEAQDHDESDDAPGQDGTKYVTSEQGRADQRAYEKSIAERGQRRLDAARAAASAASGPKPTKAELREWSRKALEDRPDDEPEGASDPDAD